jgi:hypothetical protein
MNPFKWLQRRKQESKSGVSVPNGWEETKEYLARIVGLNEPQETYYGRKSLTLFIERGFASDSPGRLAEGERRSFFKAIESSEAGESISVSSLPDVKDAVAQERFRNWVFNVIRKDKPSPPSTPRDLLLTSVVYSSDRVLQDLTKIYEYYSPQDGASKLHDLTEIGQNTHRRLGELGPFIPSLATVVTDGPVTFEDLLLVPCLMQEFLYTRDLYILEMENRSIVLLSKLWWKSGVPSSLSYVNLGEPISNFSNSIADAVGLAKAQDRRVESFYQP